MGSLYPLDLLVLNSWNRSGSDTIISMVASYSTAPSATSDGFLLPAKGTCSRDAPAVFLDSASGCAPTV